MTVTLSKIKNVSKHVMIFRFQLTGFRTTYVYFRLRRKVAYKHRSEIVQKELCKERKRDAKGLFIK